MSNVSFTIAKPEISRAEFVRMTAAKFPAVAEDILDEFYEGLIHLQVACLTRYANACIENADLAELERILRFADEVLPKVDSLLDNALHVSFIEMLYLDGDEPVRLAARKLLSPWQLAFYLEVTDFYRKLARWKLAQQTPPG